ncbi:MAG: MMPL family transporter [Parvularculaceae bacterium]|nr:MMPL family transporter [Parvularculaceae bacterium]
MLRLIERFLIVWAEGSRRLGWLVVLLFATAAAFAGFYAFKNLKVNTDTSQMLDPDLPFQKNAAELRSAFPQIKDDLVIIVRAPTLDEADAFAGDLREKLLADAKNFSAVFAPAEDPFFKQNGLLYLSKEELSSRLTQMSKASGLIETLVKSPTVDTLFSQLATNDELAERSELGKDTLEKIYEELGDVVEASLEGERRPFSWLGALDTSGAERDSYTRLVNVTPVLDYSRLQPAKPAVSEVRRLIDDLKSTYGDRVDTYITGDPALRAEELQSVSTGIGLSFLISFLSVGVLLLICYRSISLSVITLIALLLTLILTAGFAAATVGQLNLISIAFTVLLTGLGLDFAIHLLLHLQDHRFAGHETPRALRASLREVGSGLFLAAITTSIAFFSFIPTKFEGIAQLGIIAGAGVLIALAVSVTFVPAALGVYPKSSAGRKFRSGGGGFFTRIRDPLAVVVILVGLGSIFFIPQSRFDADPMSLRDPETESVKGFNMLFADPESAPYRLTRLVDSAEAAQATATAARALPGVRGTRSLPDFVPKDQEEKLDLISYAQGSLLFALEAEPEPAASTGEGAARLQARLSAAYSEGPAARLAGLLGKLANEPAAAARVEENVFLFWPHLIELLQAQMTAEEVTFETLPPPLKERYLSKEGQWRVDILPKEDLRDHRALERFVSSVEGSFPDVSGGAIQTQKAGDTISEAMLQATTIALGVIAVFLFLLVQRITQVLLMILPLALAALLTAAAGVVFNIPFNYANVIVLPLLLGLGVDSGIHLVLRNQQMKTGDDVYDTATPRAVMFSALTTIASFGSLMLSPHRGTASMGELLSIAIFFSLVCALIVLPAAFAFGERRK